MKLSKKKAVIIIMFVVIVFIEGYSIASYQTNTLIENKNNIVEANLTEEEQEVLDLVNKNREEKGIKTLKTYSKLQQIAKLKAVDIVTNNYFSHNSPTLGTPFEMLKAYGIDYKISGENLAGNINSERAFNAWMNSESHRENILEEKYEYTGICVLNSKTYGKVYVQLFVGLK